VFDSQRGDFFLRFCLPEFRQSLQYSLSSALMCAVSLCDLLISSSINHLTICHYSAIKYENSPRNSGAGLVTRLRVRRSAPIPAGTQIYLSSLRDPVLLWDSHIPLFYGLQSLFSE